MQLVILAEGRSLLQYFACSVNFASAYHITKKDQTIKHTDLWVNHLDGSIIWLGRSQCHPSPTPDYV